MSFGGYANNGGFSSDHGMRGRASFKQVFDTRQTCHVWAAQSQPHGRNAKGSVFFQGRVIYSYGSHFPMAVIMDDGAVLLNSDNYSVSTSGHQSDVRAAVSHRTTYSVPDLKELAGDHWNPISLLRPERSPEDRKRGKAGLLAYLAKHGPDMREESVAYLAGLIKRDPAPIIQRAKAARERAKAKELAETKARQLSEGKRFAEMSPQAFKSYIVDLAASWEGEAGLERFVKSLRVLHKAANAAGQTKRKAKLWGLIKQTQAAVGQAAGLRKHKEAAKAARIFMRGSEGLRNMLERIAKTHANNDSFDSSVYLHLAQKAEFVRKWKRWPAVTAQALLKLERELTEYGTRKAEAEEIAAKAEREARAAEAFRRETARREAWLSGEPNYWNGTDAQGGALLRVVGDELQTSQGARVPLSHAIKVFRFIKLVRQNGKPWRRNGQTIRVGHFTVDRIETSGDFVAGCHHIHWPEVARIAEQLGLDNVEASDDAVETSHA